MQHGGVEIVNGGYVSDGFVSEFIRRAIAEGFLYAGAGEPDGEAFGIVVAAAGAFLEGRHAAEFGDPHDQCVFKNAALLQILKQRRGGLIENRAVN